MARSTRNPVVAVAFVLALIAASCGDDGGTADDTTTTTEATTTTESSPDNTGAPPELTASAPGVTAETIKIGIPVVDTEAIGWEQTHDSEVIWQVAADAINADGGVLGREVELTTIPVSPVDFALQDEICVRFTEDEQVFAVMGVIREEVPLCYTELHSTIVINTFATRAEIYERSVAPLIGFLPLIERESAEQLQTLIDTGLLEGRKVAISSAPTTLDVADEMRTTLEDAGIEVVAVTNYESPSSDQLAIDAEMDLSYEQWRAAGADAVIPANASVPTTGVLSRNGWDGLYVVTDSPGLNIGLLDGFGYGTEALTGAIAIAAPSEADMYEADVAGVRECVDRFDNAFDDDAPVEVRPEDPTTGVLGVIVRSCQALELFKAVAELAGPDLTNDSFDAAADAIGEFSVTGVVTGSLGPGKRDYVDGAAKLFEFDDELQQFVLST